MLEWRTCATCGAEYPARAPNARYCAPSCAPKVRPAYVPVPKTVQRCADCGAIYLTNRGARYCSPRCQHNAYQRRAYRRRRANGERRVAAGWITEAAA